MKTERRKKRESLATRKQSGLPPSPSLPNSTTASPAPEATQGASCTIFDAALVPRAPLDHIVTGCAAESSTAAPGRGPWRLERGRELALVFFSPFEFCFECCFLFALFPSLCSDSCFFYLSFAFPFSLSLSAHPPVPLSLSLAAHSLSLRSSCASQRGDTQKGQGALSRQGRRVK